MSLPDWLDPLYEAAEMRAVDAWAIERQGVPSLELMERAGLGLARATAGVAGAGPIRIVIGKGNNGGDGLVAARLLREDGHELDVLSVAPLDQLQGDARANLERLPGEGPLSFEPGALAGSGAIVDAMLGTGFSGEPGSPWRGRSGRSTPRTRPWWPATCPRVWTPPAARCWATPSAPG